MAEERYRVFGGPVGERVPPGLPSQHSPPAVSEGPTGLPGTLSGRSASLSTAKSPWAVLGIALLSVLVASCGSETPEPEAGIPGGARPSVLLVTLDTTRADRLGCYGYEEARTPILDRLAKESVLFTSAIAQAAVTPVSHASILTGSNPYRHGLRVLHGREANRLPEEENTVAEVLGEAGYETAAFVSAFPAGSRFGLDQGFERFDEELETPPTDRTVTEKGVVRTGRVQRRADDTTDRALRWLRSASRPFFLWVHYFDPHDPTLVPPEEFLAEFPPLPDEPRERLRTLYDIEISFMDRELGRLLEGIDSSVDRDRLLVIVTSDHGEGLGDHDWWTHGILYQEQIRVPLLIRLPDGGTSPGSSRGGRRISRQVRTVDLVPTILDLAGIPARDRPGAMDGRTLLETLSEDGGDQEERVAYAESINRLTYNVAPEIRDVKNEVLFSLTEAPWKYIHHALDPEASELYHLERDPGEQVDLSDEHPEIVRSLRRELRRRRVLPEVLPEESSDPELKKRLEALGYVQ